MPNWRILTTVDRTVPGAGPPVDVLALTQAAARGLATAEKAKPGVIGATVHFCPHTAGESASKWYNCKTDPRSQYEEF